MRLTVVLVVALACACSGGPDHPPTRANKQQPSESRVADEPGAEVADDGAADGGAADGGACETGDTLECKVVLPSHDSIQNCWVGVRLCVDGVWSECGDEGALVKKYLGS